MKMINLMFLHMDHMPIILNLISYTTHIVSYISSSVGGPNRCNLLFSNEFTHVTLFFICSSDVSLKTK